MRVSVTTGKKLAAQCGQKLPTKAKSAPASEEEEESLGEAAFLWYWKLLAPEMEPPIHDKPIPEDTRLNPYRPDFRLPGRVIVEIEGVSHRLSRYHTDIIKYNRLVDWGYAVYRITHKMLTDDPETFVNQIKHAILQRQ